MAILFTGEKSLRHEKLRELCTESINAAKELYSYLPSVLGLGMMH